MKAATMAVSPGLTQQETLPSGRIESIDILRALTMVLMIFVNDLGSLRNIPEWLDHVKANVDGIGLADTVFPAFLFIAGMSLPYAVAGRRKKGDSDWQLIAHVLVRSLSLLIMGTFLVNGETINRVATGMDHYAWNTLSCVCFILIWNKWPATVSEKVTVGARAAGIIILCIMAFIYRGREDNGPLFRFSPQWWGILGLIGWSYLASALVTVFSKGKLLVLGGAWLAFGVLCILYSEDYIGHSGFTWYVPSAIVGGTLAGLSMGGVITSYVFEYFRRQGENLRMTAIFLVASAVLFILCYFSHKFYIISKLDASLPWLYLCSGITVLAFTAVYWLTDMGGKASWFSTIKPAGTDTLLCYLIPYFTVSLVYASHIKIPLFFLTGGIGLVKSFLFALLCVWITAKLNKAGVKLKI